MYQSGRRLADASGNESAEVHVDLLALGVRRADLGQRSVHALGGCAGAVVDVDDQVVEVLGRMTAHCLVGLADGIARPGDALAPRLGHTQARLDQRPLGGVDVGGFHLHASQDGRMRLVLVRRIFRGLTIAGVESRNGYRIRPAWRTSRA